VTFLNDGATRALECIGKDASPDVFLPKDMDEILAALKRHERATFRREATVGDRVFEESIHVTPEHDAVGIYATDITEHQQAEEALRASEERFRRAFEDSGAGKLLTGLDGRLLRVNRAFAAMLGYTVVELQSLKFAAITHPDDVALSLKVLSRLQSGTEGSARFEKRYLHKNGSVVWADLSTVLLRDAAGRPDYFVADVQNITGRKQAETALAESEFTYRRVFESSNDAMVLFESGRFLDCNETALRMFGYATRDEFLGKDVEAISPPRQADGRESRSAIEEHTVTAFRNGRDFFEWLQQRPDGTVFPVDVLLTPLEYRGQKVLQATVRDITARKQAEAELVKYRDHLAELVSARTRELELSNKELEAFSYSVSHDLRAPLRAINGFARALEEDYAAQLDAVANDYLDRMRAASCRMAELIDDLLDLARIARLPLERKPVNLSELARTITGELREAEPARQVELVIQDGMTAQADPVLAAILLRNLLDNAWKFTGKHPTARIEVGETVRDGEPVWFVRDDGAGFDMAHVDSLFAPFQRLHAAGDFTGTGIGLATVQRIVRRHGGRGWIEGAVENGATYYFTFAKTAKEA
jgi:PAS domain S-box-containing protein